jgi:hypothetical protein
MDCKVENYDKYSLALKARNAQRVKDLDTIQKLVETAGPARGAAGARCEKALSNGTFRPARGPKSGACTGDTACCGAARVPMSNGAWMTIETCGTTTQTNYKYVAPRAPMATTEAAGTDYTFTCIQGAQKLAAAASALAAAVYMLA